MKKYKKITSNFYEDISYYFRQENIYAEYFNLFNGIKLSEKAQEIYDSVKEDYDKILNQYNEDRKRNKA